MTPEERLTKIENLLQATAEHQAKQQEEFARQQEQFARQQEHSARQDQEIEKHNEAIRGLIVVSRTCLDSIQEQHKRVMAEIDKLREAQAATDEKLNILIDTVERIIRRRNGSE
jgi:hypothetical protein